MEMCTSAAQHVNALITAQSRGTILVMVAWFLACVLALCVALRIITRYRSQGLHRLALLDDATIIAAAICGLGATVVISTAVDSGLGKRPCLISSSDIDRIQIKVFVSTILFVLALSISKCSVLLFLHQLANNTAQRLGLIIIGFVVVIWTLGVMTGIVFECEMPRPWEIWTGKCIPLLPFWITITSVDIVIDLTLILLSAHMVWTLQLDYHQKTVATTILSLRIFLITTSSLRLAFLKDALSPSSDPTFTSIPYAITTQIHSALSIILSCTLTLKPLTNLLYAARSQPSLSRRPSKHWSGSTVGIGGTPYESYSSFSSKTHIIQEPLHTIQRAMSTPNSPVASNEDIILPEILLPARYAKAPPRPPPPSDAERPDLSMFTQTTCLRPVPVVTNLNGKMWGIGRNKSLVERGLV